MLGKLLLRRKLKKLHNEQEDVFRRAELQALLLPIERDISPRVLRKLKVDVFTENAHRLTTNLTIAIDAVKGDGYIKHFKGTSTSKGTKSLSEWLTSSEGFSIYPGTTDAALHKLLAELIEEINNYEREQKGDKVQYYKRKLITLIKEALKIRLLLHEAGS